MPVYVDKIRTIKPRSAFVRQWGTRWCHLTADTPDELHAMADQLGLKRRWFQPHPRHPHYDLTPPKRAAAVSLGALERA
jgi:hypothetical protein